MNQNPHTQLQHHVLHHMPNWISVTFHQQLVSKLYRDFATRAHTLKTTKTSLLKPGNTVNKFIHIVSVVQLGRQKIFDKNK